MSQPYNTYQPQPGQQFAPQQGYQQQQPQQGYGQPQQGYQSQQAYGQPPQAPPQGFQPTTFGAGPQAPNVQSFSEVAGDLVNFGAYLADAETAGVWEDGSFRLEIEDVEAFRSDSLRVTYRCLASQNAPYVGKTFKDYLNFGTNTSPFQKRRTVMTLTGFGITKDQLQSLGEAPPQILIPLLRGKVADVDLGHYGDGERKRNQFNSVTFVPGGGGAPVGAPPQGGAPQFGPQQGQPQQGQPQFGQLPAWQQPQAGQPLPTPPQPDPNQPGPQAPPSPGQPQPLYGGGNMPGGPGIGQFMQPGQQPGQPYGQPPQVNGNGGYPPAQNAQQAAQQLQQQQPVQMPPNMDPALWARLDEATRQNIAAGITGAGGGAPAGQPV